MAMSSKEYARRPRLPRPMSISVTAQPYRRPGCEAGRMSGDRHDDLTDVPGIRVGHATRDTGGRRTGCTVIVPETSCAAGVDVRGGAPGTRETDLLDPRNLVDRVDAVVLSGGSAFGLRTADGVMDALAELGRGWPVGDGVVVPIVPAAI